MTDIQRLENRLKREKKARQEAETLLVSKAKELFEKNQELEEVLASLEDTVRERTAELNEAVREANDASNAKSRFLATMSHEIRTPLNGVVGMASLLLSTNLTKEQKEYVGSITKSADALQIIINDILDLSKVEAGKFDLIVEKNNPIRILGDTISLMSPLANEKGLALSFDYQKTNSDLYWCDGARLRQICLNLLGNAIKFTPSGFVQMTFRSVEERDAFELFEISVTDTGIGISEEDQKRVFDNFVQLELPSSPENNGTGLGLPITKNFISLMGGEISVKSAVGEGSCFKFTLPLQIADAGEEINSAPHMEEPDLPTDLNILIVEDNLVNQKVSSLLLKKMGQKPSLAENGRKAVEMVRESKFDLIFMDMQMPVMNGLEATRLIRQFEQKQGLYTPIVALTANAMKDDIEACKKAGMDDIVSKPFKRPDLEKALIRILGTP